MKPAEFLLFLLFAFFMQHGFSQSHERMWSVQTNSDDYGGYSGLAIDLENNYYISGSFYGGNLQVGDSVFQCETGSEKSFIAGYDHDGNFRWALGVGKKNDSPDGDVGFLRLAVDSQKNLYVAGEFDVSVDLGDTSFQSYGNWDVFIAKYSENGQFIWAYHVGGLTYDDCRDFKIDYRDNLFLTLNHSRPAFDNEVIYGDNDTVLHFNSYCAAVLSMDANASFSWIKAGTSDFEAKAENLFLYDDRHLFAQFYITGDFLFGGYTLEADLEPVTHLVIPFDEYGTPGQSRKFPFQWTSDMLIDMQSNIYVAGYFNDPIIILGDTVKAVNFIDYLLVKYNYKMEPVWYQHLLNTPYFLDLKICSDNDDGIYLSTPFYDSVYFADTVLYTQNGTGLFIADLDQAGHCRDVILFEGSLYMIVSRIEPDHCNNIMMFGGYAGQVYLGNDTIGTPDGQEEALLVKISSKQDPFLDIGPDTAILLTDSLIISAGSDLVNILWSDGSTGNEMIFRAMQYGPGYHKIWVYAENGPGCSDSDTLTIQVIDNSLVPDLSPLIRRIYPNPANEVLHIELNNTKSIQGNIAAEIINPDGKVMYAGILKDKEHFKLDISSLRSGMYYLVLKDENQVVDECKFVKMK